jgi:O-antigen/teichoic acid export membrane protein
MNTAGRIIKNTLSLLCSGVISQMFGFVVVIYLARVLGPDAFGKINFALAFMAFAILLANLGMPLWGTKEIAADKSRIASITANIVLLRLMLSVAGFIALVLISLLLDKSPDINALLILYGLGLFPMALYLDWVFQGVEKMEIIGAGRVVTALANMGLILLLVRGPGQLIWIPVINALAGLAGAILLLVIFRRREGGLVLRFEWQACRMIIRQSLPLGISMFLIQVIYYLDTILLGFMRSDAEVGVYNAAYKIALFAVMAGAFYFDAIFPVISQYYRKSLEAVHRLLSYSARLVAILAIPLGIGCTLLAKPLLRLVYGQRYEHSAIAMQILIWAAVLIFFNMIYARAMWACNQQKAYVKIVAGQALLNVVVNVACIPWLGIAGAAAGKVAAELAGLLFYYREFSKIVRVPFLPYIGKPLLASAPMAVFLAAGQYFISLDIFSLAAGGFIIYCVTLYLCRGVTRQDAVFLKNIFLKKDAAAAAGGNE